MAQPPNTFTRAVVEAMQKLYPLENADTSWDNVGLLLDNMPDGEMMGQRVLLTTDLTTRVVDEAIEKEVSVIVSYHPIIFRGLKAITNQNPQQVSLLRLVQKNIAVYCPHTALDAAEGGINDWLIDNVRRGITGLNSQVTQVVTLKPICGTNSTIGYGRQVDFQPPVDAMKLVNFIIEQLGEGSGTVPKQNVLVAQPEKCYGGSSQTPEQYARNNLVSSVAVCAGSGADILRAAKTADLFLTGEMSHHDALAAVHDQKWVVCTLHSNSERGFLAGRLLQTLDRELRDAGLNAQVLVSEADRDPFVFQFTH